LWITILSTVFIHKLTENEKRNLKLFTNSG
jgi:hypothetical protein